MTILPFHISEVVHTYNRASKLNPSSILESERSEPKDIVNISSEAKKRQVLEQAKSEVLERIKGT